jgi:ferric-dicitrate binding protein FerR (iron transport regulator)
MNVEKNGLHKIVTSGYLLKIAASFISILALSISILYISGIFSTNSNQIVWNERKTVSGEKSIVNFSDGTKITLNGNSKLKYLAKPFNNRREVYLEGEAFFEVNHDSSRQFVVNCNNISTTDIGTKFNISAYSNEKEIKVSLVAGQVNISEYETDHIKKETMLQPKQQYLYNTINKTYNIKEFDVEEIIGWKDNYLKFNNETLTNVFARLERAYGVKFELAPGVSGNYLITTNFQNTSLMTITEAIKKFTGFNYTTIKENDQTKKIIFEKK